jgi:hypothetical protein
MRKSHLVYISILLFLAGCKKEKEPSFLFNGTDLTGWDTYLGIPQSVLDVPYLDKDSTGKYTEAFGLNYDPMQVFSVTTEDGANVIRISGYIWGALITKEEYENYHLHLEFKWGEQKSAPREELPRNSGLCYHSTGAYGVFWTYWMRSFELEIMEGGLGDFVRVDETFADIRAEYDPESGSPGYRYSSEGEIRSVSYNLYKVNAAGEYENPYGEWNSVDLYTLNQEAIHIINGQVAICAENLHEQTGDVTVPLTKGKIQLQSEGAEIFYRNIYIEPIEALPETN